MKHVYLKKALVGLLMFYGPFLIAVPEKSSPVPEQTRHDLLQARDAAWRVFFDAEAGGWIERLISRGSYDVCSWSGGVNLTNHQSVITVH